jgi:hypothetical protein
MTDNGAGLRQTSRRPTTPLSACIRGTGSGTPIRRPPFHFHKGALVEPIRHLGRTSQVTANLLVTAAPERNRHGCDIGTRGVYDVNSSCGGELLEAGRVDAANHAAAQRAACEAVATQRLGVEAGAGGAGLDALAPTRGRGFGAALLRTETGAL